jgi:hypothetical protein
MTLPNTFGPETSAAMVQLDQNFAAVGALTTLLCTASGTNAIVLTPAANQPTVGGYGLPNPLKFGFLAAASSSGAVTLEVATFGFLPVYLPTGSQATAGTLVSGQYYEVTYTTGSSYNSGNGAWVLSSYQASTGVTAVSNASVSGLQLYNNSGTPSTQITIGFTQACLVSAIGAPAFIGASATNVDLTTGTAVSTANGMDGESRPASGWVYIYAISTGSGMAGLGTLTSPLSGPPTLPSGYPYYAYLGAMYCDSSSNLLRTRQLGRSAQYTLVASSNTANIPIIASGTAGTYSSTSPTLAAASVSAFVPPTAARITIGVTNDWKGAGSEASVQVAPNAAWGGTNNGPYASGGNIWPVPLPSAAGQLTQQAEMLLESSSIYWASTGAGGAIGCLGWSDFVSAAT